MVVGEASIHNIMGGMESTGGVRLHNHKRKLKQRFDIIKKLGQGTYGKVQLGINKETGQEVAIKTIKKCKIETEADLIRIRREIQIMSSVQHPNIIHIYEVFENREKMVLVMEYAAGGELYDYLSERKVLSEHEARRIFRQIATAVFYCHKHKICHRDLKLENILLDQVGNAKIADFGLSNVFDEQRLLNTFCGSPLYASPEIVKGTPYHGPEVDCWSLGVLLYTLVYGAMPFDGSNFKRLVKQISQSDYFEPRKPSPASPLIKDMLTVSPGKRADIEKICTHWWVNEGYEQNCLDIAEELAAQTPVRLDLLLSLVPQSASAEKLVVGDDRQAAGDVANNVSSETLVPTRCHSVGSLMEIDRNNSDRRIRELMEEEPRTAPAAGDAKRKLETTPSMDETAAAGVKRKERSRRKERTDEREPRTYRSASRHHSAPIPNAITEEAMEVDPVVPVPTSSTILVDPSGAESTAVSLELIKECNERSPSKERSGMPVTASQRQQEPIDHPSMENNLRTADRDDKHPRNEVEKSLDKGYREEPTSGVVSVNAENLGMTRDERPIVPKTAVSSSETAVNDNDDNAAAYASQDSLEATQREFKKLKEKALSLDSELAAETRDVPAKTFERRRSKIFETAEKFNQMASGVETEKPKKIFIPGVNVGGAKRVFERKASLSSIGAPPPAKPSASKVIIDVPTDKKIEKSKQPRDVRSGEPDGVELEEAKKRAVDIITGAIGKPPVQRRVNGSPPMSPPGQDAAEKLPLKIPVGTNDLRTATVSVSTPVDSNFTFDDKSFDTANKPTASISSVAATVNDDGEDSQPDEPRMSSKMEITLKSATLPRPRKTSKAEISLSGTKSSEPVAAFRSELEAKIDAFQPQKLRTQRSEVAFPVAAAIPHSNRSASLEPDTRPKNLVPKERIIPIQAMSAPKPPMPQRSMSQRSGSLSRQSTADSDTDSALGSTTLGPEPIRKSPREYIIPIAVEGGGYVTPRSGSVEPESKTGTPTSANAPTRSRFGRPRRMSSLLSDASEDESPFSTLHRDSEDLLQRHMHRLRSSRPSRQPSEHADSLSSGEDDDDDGFELLTAENLFSTLLSRVRSLTQRLNVDDNRNAGFPSSRLFGRLGSNSSPAFWALNKPLSRRLTESQFRHSRSRDGDVFSRKDSVDSSTNPGSPNSPGSHNTSARETVFDIGSNTLPRETETETESEPKPAAAEAESEAEAEARISKETQESVEQSFTPSLAKRLSRSFIEQTRRSLPYETRYRRLSPCRESRNALFLDSSEAGDRSSESTVSDQTEYKEHRPANNVVRRSNSLLESSGSREGYGCRGSPRRSVSLFDDDIDVDRESNERGEDSLQTLFAQHASTLGRKYKESTPSGTTGKHRRENFRSYRTDKIQEETADDAFASSWKSDPENQENHATENSSVSDCASANLPDAMSSVSTKSYDTSPTTESSWNALDYKSSSSATAAAAAAYVPRSDPSRSFENRLLAAENLIKESKLRNLGPSRFDPNLSSSYRDTDKCEKQSLISIGETGNCSSMVAKRRTCIPSLRLRSGSLTREPTSAVDRRKSFADTRDLGFTAARALTPEKSILSKLFKSAGNRENDSKEREKEKEKEKPQKSKQHRISRFLRPDFFDTPREESRYAKEKEERKAAENERRKSRFMRRKTENRSQETKSGVEQEKREKELKNEINALRKDRRPEESADVKTEKNSPPKETVETRKIEERRGSRNSFLHSLEKKLERLRSSEEVVAATTKPVANGGIANESREFSAPPGERRSAPETDSLRKAASVEDVSANKPVGRTARSKVSSVLGLFKSVDTKQIAGPSRVVAQNTILSRLKKSPPKSTKPDTTVAFGDDASSSSGGGGGGGGSSRIPTKLGVKADSKPTKRLVGEKPGSESPKRSPPKEKASTVKEKTGSSENGSKRTSPSTEIAEEFAGEKRATELAREDPTNGAIDKKLLKTRKNRSLVENGSSAETAKRDEAEKRNTVKNNDTDGTLKKRKKKPTTTTTNTTTATTTTTTTRTVKKIAKKSSDGSDEKPDETGKTAKPRVKKKLGHTGETSSESTGSSGAAAKTVVAKTKENGVDSQTNGRTSARSNYGDAKTAAVSSRKPSLDSPGEDSIVLDAKNGLTKAQQESQRANRSNLKLDLTKIPQHSFRNTTPKKESPKSESPRIPGESPKAATDKLMECLSKVTHRASITGNKIIIDKPLRAKDVAELRKEVTECAKFLESRAESGNDESATISRPAADLPEEQDNGKSVGTETDRTEPSNNQRTPPLLDRYTNEPFSPVDEPESFDSWSVSSTELNHARADLHSPTSPSHSLYARSDNSESVIDRIRRRSFYSRFNDRRRPSLTAPPPGLGLSSSSVALPRKYSFSGHREQRDRSKYVGLGTVSLARHADRRSRSYDLFADDGIVARNSFLDRSPRYSDATTSSSSSYIADPRSSIEHLPPLSSSYDPLRRYIRSPTFDLSSSRARYHSVDFPIDADLESYRSPVSGLPSEPTTVGCFASSSLPRKYRSSASEPKTVEYYEELLAPTGSDYLQIRKLPMNLEYPNRCENGHYNGGTVDLRSSGPNRKGHTEPAIVTDLLEQDEERSTERRRYGWFVDTSTSPTNDPRLRFPRTKTDFVANELEIRFVQRGLPVEKFTGIPFKV
ncbi:NUAK family SNF1-like kinase 1 [Dufourea novaeangliae]|uniref:NUAK family SNF1-like kinase 1 n=1 Tax=Dufourea novaeangliae TaxID=178035 RepID=A0A154P9X2_DUFNO|nr:NUAK family SNF1-like kinase 1 [Dufourea novaeangliae]